MSHTLLHQKALQNFKASLHGEVISPNDEGYESARRVWNAMPPSHSQRFGRCPARDR